MRTFFFRNKYLRTLSLFLGSFLSVASSEPFLVFLVLILGPFLDVILRFDNAVQRSLYIPKQLTPHTLFKLELISLQLPLGSCAAIVGMNNADANDNIWMSLNQQIIYMGKLPLQFSL